MSEIVSIKLPVHQDKARVYDASGKYLFWISLAGEINRLEDEREKGESWLDFRNRIKPRHEALEVEELSIARLFVEAINSHETNTAALAAKDAEIEKLKAALTPFADVADFMDAETTGFAMTDTLKLYVDEEGFPALLVDTFCIQRFYTARAALKGEAP